MNSATENIDTHISEIVELLMKNRLGFLFGAGMSFESGGVSGSELSYNMIWKSFYKDKHDPDTQLKKEMLVVSQKHPLEAIAQAAASNMAFMTDDLVDLLKEDVFRGSKPIPHQGHMDFASVLNTFHINMVFTTNFDDLLEKALTERAKTITERTFRELDKIQQNNETAIIHLHGTFNDKPLIMEGDLMKYDGPLFSVFMSELLRKAFVFVGYSLSDPNIRAIYTKASSVLSRREDLMKKTYIVAPPMNDVDLKVSREVWRARCAEYIPLGAKEFFSRLQAQVVTRYEHQLKESIKKKLNVSSDELMKRVDQILSVFPEFGDSIQVLRYIDEMTKSVKD